VENGELSFSFGKPAAGTRQSETDEELVG